MCTCVFVFTTRVRYNVQINFLSLISFGRPSDPVRQIRYYSLRSIHPLRHPCDTLHIKCPSDLSNSYPTYPAYQTLTPYLSILLIFLRNFCYPRSRAKGIHHSAARKISHRRRRWGDFIWQIWEECRGGTRSVGEGISRNVMWSRQEKWNHRSSVFLPFYPVVFLTIKNASVFDESEAE